MINESYKEMRHTINVGRSTIYVDDDNTAGPWGETLENRYQFIQDRIDSAAGGDIEPELNARTSKKQLKLCCIVL